MARLYIETNYLMSICTGRTPRAETLLAAPESIELAIPGLCITEAYKAFAGLRYDKTQFRKPFPKQIDDVGRDVDVHAQEFKRSLAAADAALTQYLGQSEARLLDAMQGVLSRARIVHPSAGVLMRRLYSHLSEPTDDIIAASIIEDATQHAAAPMAFFSEDQGFQQPSLGDAMIAANIENLDSQLSSRLEWIKQVATS